VVDYCKKEGVLIREEKMESYNVTYIPFSLSI